MKISPKCRTKKLGMLYTISGRGAIILSEIRPKKIPDVKTGG